VHIVVKDTTTITPTNPLTVTVTVKLSLTCAAVLSVRENNATD